MLHVGLMALPAELDVPEIGLRVNLPTDIGAAAAQQGPKCRSSMIEWSGSAQPLDFDSLDGAAEQSSGAEQRSGAAPTMEEVQAAGADC